jgi:hemerythrin
MSLIQWNTQLSVGVQVIDQQHQKLVGMINDLDDAMRRGAGKTVVGKIVNEMVDYTISHFQLEENYFKQFGYPDADSHKQEHARFIQKVQAFKAELQAGRIGLTIQVMGFLSDWLQNHIQGVDKKYGPFFNARGLK